MTKCAIAETAGYKCHSQGALRAALNAHLNVDTPETLGGSGSGSGGLATQTQLKDDGALIGHFGLCQLWEQLPDSFIRRKRGLNTVLGRGTR